MEKTLYVVCYCNDRFDACFDNVLAESEEECMRKFSEHHPEEKGVIIDWKRIDY